MARAPGGGLVGRLLSGMLGRPEREGGEPDQEAERREANERLEAAQQRLKQEIPPPEEAPDRRPQ